MIVERGTDLLDAGVQAVLEVNEGFLAPNLLPELLPSDQLAGARGEQDEDFGGLGRQVDLPPGFPEFAALGVQLEEPKAQQRRFRTPSDHRCSPPDDYTGNRQICHRSCRPATT